MESRKITDSGFTLVEMLVVIAVLSIIGIIIATIFVRTLRLTNKNEIISHIKQNGQASLEDIDKTVRNADHLVCVSSNPPNTIVVNKGGLYTRFRFVPKTSSINGAIQKDHVTPSATETTPTPFINRVCNALDPMINALILTDTNPLTGVAIIEGSFTQDKSPGFKDTVKIVFVLGPGLSVPLAISSQIDPIVFQTTIELR